MIEDSIVNEIRKHRQAHAKQYDNDLDKIVEALKKKEKISNKKMVTLKPRLIKSQSA